MTTVYVEETWFRLGDLIKSCISDIEYHIFRNFTSSINPVAAWEICIEHGIWIQLLIFHMLYIYIYNMYIKRPGMLPRLDAYSSEAQTLTLVPHIVLF